MEKNNTFCLNCGVISQGETCNNCGEINLVPAHDYLENGIKRCKNCGTVFRYPVNKCAMCDNKEV